MTVREMRRDRIIAHTVGAFDLLSLLVAWGTDPGGPPDFDGDVTPRREA